ncbi:hypothetical protein [Mycoplasmopsis cynos]|uniref:hypothetical protein n=1 Tax=Mycoplasmopsis cynos TaxID=171284 RepID=UPI0022074879|nr:hypothetical protein [Mycoplasmopsis cynos]UWV81763.1 hypothetical protein NW065_01225 [Mycoplasmopsis cynos]
MRNFAFEFWENHEILTNNLKIKQPCYKKISTNFFLKCINLENKNDIHKEKFNLTRLELEYFIKVYKLIYSIKETDDLYWILYYNNSSKTENVLETEYYKYIYSNDIFLKINLIQLMIHLIFLRKNRILILILILKKMFEGYYLLQVHYLNTTITLILKIKTLILENIILNIHI